jgi:ABC-type polar amino acid transport system ATPase subunit
VADRVVMFDEGVIIEEGPQKRVFTCADHERTRRFLSQLHWEGA